MKLPLTEAAPLERLQRLLGGPELSELRQRLRGRYERGEQRDTFTLTGLVAGERRALTGLLGRSAKPAVSMRLSMIELDAAIVRAGLAGGLRSALEMLDGPIRDLAGERCAARESWSTLLASMPEPRLATLVSQAAGAGLLKRLSGRDASRARELVDQASRVLARLPARGIPLARLAAEAIGDSHGLDAGRPVATLVLRACGSAETRTSQVSTSNSVAGADTATDMGGADAVANAGASAGTVARAELDERPREQWARLGVAVNELAMPALCLNLGIAAPGEPVHVSLRKLIRTPPSWDIASRTVFVCENPNIVAIAADSLGPACAPLVCTEGMPGAAQQALLRQLATCGARLRYHGDFDWAGLAIGNFIARTFGTAPWAFGAADYLSACAGISRERNPHTPLSGERIEAIWDDGLAGEMAERGIAVHEEALADTLLKDLRT